MIQYQMVIKFSKYGSNGLGDLMRVLIGKSMESGTPFDESNEIIHVECAAISAEAETLDLSSGETSVSDCAQLSDKERDGLSLVKR